MELTQVLINLTKDSWLLITDLVEQFKMSSCINLMHEIKPSIRPKGKHACKMWWQWAALHYPRIATKLFRQKLRT
jgi:phytoene dehydrogenase-like protein